MRGNIPRRLPRLTMGNFEMYDDVLASAYCGRGSSIFNGPVPDVVLRAASRKVRTVEWSKPTRFPMGILRDDPYINMAWYGNSGTTPLPRPQDLLLVR